jgi:spore germination protein
MKVTSSLFISLALLISYGSICAAETSPKKPLEISAWLAFWDAPNYPGFESFKANVGRLSRVYLQTYRCQADGLPALIDTTKPEDITKVVTLAHAHEVKVLGQMDNWSYTTNGFDGKLVEKFLQNPVLLDRHIDSLLALAKTDHLDGLAVDYESLEAADRDLFSTFVARLCARAHTQGLLVSVALFAKDSEPGVWSGAQSQDLAALGKNADIVQVMTYDYHWQTGPPGSIAPPAWIRSCVAFTATKINPDKIELGVNVYGYSWHPQGENLSWPGFLKLKTSEGPLVRDPETLELKLMVHGGEAWMPDALTCEKKFEIANELGVRGVHIFILGEEDPDFWSGWDRFIQAHPRP